MNIVHHVSLAISVRIGLLLYGIYHDQHYAVKYTDIDYYVFTDAARYLYHGTSPFHRDTYRYSPLLAFILCPNIFIHEAFGKVVFLLFDVLTGYLTYKILKRYSINSKMSLLCSCLWLYNPISAVISTRGSCDSIMTVLMLFCIYLFQCKRIGLFGLIYGIIVHFRLYPCIHALTFYTILSNFHAKNSYGLKKLQTILYPNHEKCLFVICSALGFFVPTFVSYYLYGSKFINEAFLYHVLRKDIKHNFSPYFYFTYLTESSDETVNVMCFVPFLAQLSLLLLSTWVFSSVNNLPSCLFIQTCIFVTFNKVCTSQYFLWYLCLFPLNVPILKMKDSVLGILIFWFSGQILWLMPAYYLEFEGMNTFLLIWCAGLIMFLMYVYLFYLFCKNCPLSGYKVEDLKKCK